MIFVLLGLLILILSFVIAFASLIRESSKRGKEAGKGEVQQESSVTQKEEPKASSQESEKVKEEPFPWETQALQTPEVSRQDDYGKLSEAQIKRHLENLKNGQKIEENPVEEEPQQPVKTPAPQISPTFGSPKNLTAAQNQTKDNKDGFSLKDILTEEENSQ